MSFEEKFESEVESCILKLVCSSKNQNDEKFYRDIAKELKKIKIKYWNVSDSNISKVRLLRNLLLIYDVLEEKEIVRLYTNELYNFAIESNLKEEYELEYCRAMNCYIDTFSKELGTKEKVRIEKENIEVYKRMGLEYKPDFLTAKVNIKFLMEDYNSVVNILLEIHM